MGRRRRLPLTFSGRRRLVLRLGERAGGGHPVRSRGLSCDDAAPVGASAQERLHEQGERECGGDEPESAAERRPRRPSFSSRLEVAHERVTTMPDVRFCTVLRAAIKRPRQLPSGDAVKRGRSSTLVRWRPTGSVAARPADASCVPLSSPRPVGEWRKPAESSAACASTSSSARSCGSARRRCRRTLSLWRRSRPPSESARVPRGGDPG